MSKYARIFGMLAAAFVALMWIAPAQAQATRTWVSGVGDDANPCSRTAPCKTFAGAISKTAAGGEINCLDPGGFGALTITKAISIICIGVEGGVLVSGTNGITVAAGPNDSVILNGLDIEGLGSSINGVSVSSAGAVSISNCTIRGFNAGSATGISFTPNSPSGLTVTNTLISENGIGGSGGGIIIKPTTGGSAIANISGVQVVDNTNGGLLVSSVTASGTGANATVTNSTFTGNSVAGISAVASSLPAGIWLNNDVVAYNSTGISVSSTTQASVLVTQSMIESNIGIGVTQSGTSTINTFGDNILLGNTPNGAFNTPNLAKK